MATLNESFGKEGTQVCTESWFQVEEEEGISHVRSHEEVQELLADAVTEKSREMTKLYNEDSDDGQPLSFVCKEEATPVNTTIDSEQNTSCNNGLLSVLVQSLYIGRRLSA